MLPQYCQPPICAHCARIRSAFPERCGREQAGPVPAEVTDRFLARQEQIFRLATVLSQPAGRQAAEEQSPRV